jgi:SET domain-containing protein
MTKEEIIKDLENNIYCRIQPSEIQGVGVFAIRNIPKGTNPFITYTNVETVAIPEKEIMENKKIPSAVKEMVKDFYVIQDGNLYCDARSLNEINITYFLNHSDTPNLDVNEIDGESVFTANRDILVGEELTSNYSMYSDSYDIKNNNQKTL